MLKAEIKKEVVMTNKEIALFLFEDESVLEDIEETLDDMLYNKYDMDYRTRCVALKKLTTKDYIEILRLLADKMEEYV